MVSGVRRQSEIRDQKSKINPKTPMRGQSAERPDRFIVKKRLIFLSNFLE
jgi:hypothetical protein